MAYITISIILLILFLDVGLQIEHNNNTKIYLLISSLKIKLNLKSFDRFIEEASHKTSKENVDNFKKNLSLVKPIKHIMAGKTYYGGSYNWLYWYYPFWWSYRY